MAIELTLPTLSPVINAAQENTEQKKRGGKETARVTFQEFSRGLNAFAAMSNKKNGRNVNLRKGETWEDVQKAWEDVANAPNVVSREGEHAPTICMYTVRQDEGITATCTKYSAKIQVTAGKNGQQRYDVVWGEEETEVYTPKF